MINQKNNYDFKRLEVHVVNHCNLNCAACAHFSNICEPFFLDLSQFEKDVFEITKKIKYELINILGGEPLLHPQISEFFYSLRNICPDTILTLTTNGILLPTMDEKFWQSMSENNVAIRYSFYPKTIKSAKKIVDLIHSNNVKIWDLWDGRKFYLRKSKEYNSDIDSVWASCDSKLCHQLYQGKLYMCPISAYGKFYNKYFSKEFYVEDGINIYENSSEQIKSYMQTPAKNCKTCSNVGRTINWCLSEFNEEEWDV